MRRNTSRGAPPGVEAALRAATRALASASNRVPGRPELEPIAAEAKTRLQSALATIAATAG